MKRNKTRHIAVTLLKIAGALLLLAFVILGFLWLATPDVSGFRS